MAADNKTTLTSFLKSIETKHIALAIVFAVLIGIFTNLLSDMMIGGVRAVTGSRHAVVFYGVQVGILVAIASIVTAVILSEPLANIASVE